MRKQTTEYYLTEKMIFVDRVVHLLCTDGIISYHHSATAAGYIRVGVAEVDLYSGRFGNGLIVRYNNPLSNRYCRIEYYLTNNMGNMRDRLLDGLCGCHTLEDILNE